MVPMGSPWASRRWRRDDDSDDQEETQRLSQQRDVPNEMDDLFIGGWTCHMAFLGSLLVLGVLVVARMAIMDVANYHPPCNDHLISKHLHCVTDPTNARTFADHLLRKGTSKGDEDALPEPKEAGGSQNQVPRRRLVAWELTAPAADPSSRSAFYPVLDAFDR